MRYINVYSLLMGPTAIFLDGLCELFLLSRSACSPFVSFFCLTLVSPSESDTDRSSAFYFFLDLSLLKVKLFFISIDFELNDLVFTLLALLVYDSSVRAIDPL